MVGIRPGALYYDDIYPRDMFVKAISIARECARSRKSGLVGQMCFETENWPHVSSLKTPESQMRECALALFNGVDSLALYWFSFATFESLENYQYYFDTLAEYRPYFETVQRACADTQLTGIAPYYGENSMLFPDYQLAYHQLEALLFGAYPFTVAEADPRIYALNGRLAGLLTENDVKNLMKKNVLLDIEAYRCLAKILPDHSVFAKIRLADDLPQWQKCLPGTEVFDGEHFRFTPRVPVLPQSPDVRAFSTILEMPDAVGTCVIPTGEGGNLLLTQRFDKHWTTLIRKAVADMLDLVTDGKFPARMLTGGFSVSLQTRNNKAGKTTALYLQNVSVGRTMPLDVSIRCPEKGDYTLYRGCEAPQKLCCRYVGSDEMIVTVPPLQAWQSALIAVSVN